MFPQPQPFHRPIIEDVFVYNFIHIRYRNPNIKNTIRIHRNGLSEITDIETTRTLGAYTDPYGKSNVFQFLFKRIHNFHPVCFPAAAAGGTGCTLVGADKNVFLINEFVTFGHDCCAFIAVNFSIKYMR